MIPSASDSETLWEHIYRYGFATQWARGRRVLDVACGSGYGTAALVRAGAKSAIGADVSAEACAFANKEFGVDARVANAEALPFPGGEFDLVVSFETIEHLHHPVVFLDECRRVLGPDGILVISTPNKTAYREITPSNPFHVHELSREDFVRECRRRFRSVAVFTQRPLAAPWWSPRGAAANSWPTLRVPTTLRLRNWLVRQLHPELGAAGTASARSNPVDAILRAAQHRRTFANPYAIRADRGAQCETPVYLIAVCRGPITTDAPTRLDV